MATATDTTAFETGREVGVIIAAAICYSAIGTRTLWGRVSTETEKAVELTTDFGPIWFPKKALLPVAGVAGMFRLARWFTPNEYQGRIFDKVEAMVSSAVI